MKKILNEGNQIHNIISSSGSGTVMKYGSGSSFLTSYSSGSTRQKVTVPTVLVPQRCLEVYVPHHQDLVLTTSANTILILVFFVARTGLAVVQIIAGNYHSFNRLQNLPDKQTFSVT
jgi:hypothetical protein